MLDPELNKNKNRHKTRPIPCLVPRIVFLAFAVVPSHLYAVDFSTDEVSARMYTILSVGGSQRLEERSAQQVGVASGGVGGSLNTDDGNLNFDKGDFYSRLVKGSSDLIVSYHDYGLFTRARYWYDFELKDDKHNHPGGLSAEGRHNASGAEFLDAYVWGDYWINDTSLSLRLGYQVVSWGESTFIFNGVNVINPVDVGAIRAPGAEVKDAFLPVNMLYGSSSVSDNITLEAFYQFQYEQTRLDDCGTFFSTSDYVAEGCNNIYLSPINPNEKLSRKGDKDVKDEGQFGLAIKWFAPELNETEFGLYYIEYHSRFPTVGGVVPLDPSDPLNPNHGAAYFVEYPEEIKLLGISFNTNGPWGGSFSGEYSFKKDAPVQLNAHDLILGALVQPVSPVFQDRVPDVDMNGIIDETDAFLANFFGSEQSGYDRYDVSQLQFTTIKFFNQFAGTERTILVAEVGATYIHHFPSPDKGGIRYGRNEQVGFGLTNAGLAACSATNSVVPSNVACTTEGYTTQFSWGYRVRVAFQYNSVADGVNLTPQLFWSHDVEGYAPDPGANFVEGRQLVGLSFAAEYLNNTKATLAYTNYLGAERYNYLVDRDNISLSLSYSF